MENREIARVLWETADLMEIAGEDSLPHPQLSQRRHGDRRLSRAHRRHPARPGAQSHRYSGHRQRPGGGAGTRSSSAAPASGATLLLQKFPPTALEFLKIQGLGPKSIALIFEHYRISTIDELERLCQEQKLRVLPRMGAKLEEKVLRSIAQYRSAAAATC